MRRAFALLVLITLTGCRCGRLTDGTCEGSWGDATLVDAPLDRTSRMTVVRTQQCGEPDTFKYDLSWGGGRFTMRFDLKEAAPTVLAAKTYSLPSTDLMNFAVSPDEEATGTLKLGLRGMEGDRTGTLHLKSASQELTCTFAVSYETEGTLLYCDPPDGGDGG